MAGDAIDLQGVTKTVEGLNKGFHEFKSTYDEKLKELESKGSVDPILEEKLGKIEKDMDRMQEVADKAVLAAKMKSRVVTDADGNEVDLEAKAASHSRAIGSALARPAPAMTVEALDEYKAAYAKYSRKGLDELSVEERKALSVGGDTTGGYVVNPDMSGRIVKRNFETSPMRAYASIQVISGDALEGLYDTDEAGAEWVAETQSRTETDTPDLGAWRIPAHELSALPRATQKILDDAEINIESWLADKVADRFGRKEADAFVNGDGTAKPRGFLTYPDLTTPDTFQIGAIEQFDTGVNGDFPADPNGGNVLIDALYGLKAPYRANATWFFNRSVTKAVRKLQDSDGAYIWQPGIAAGQPASLLGYPIAAFEDMPNIATGSLSIAVGDMRAAYQIVDRIGIRTLRDPFSAKPHIEFYTTKRVGGDVIDFDALKLIKFAA
jgi:HK97 family phage major capsid protein